MAWHTHKKLTLGQSSNWSNPVNSYLTTWLLNITDEVWLRLINLRERLSVGWYTTTMYNILFLNCNLCSTKNDLLYLSEGSLELKQAICCLIVFVVHDQTSQDTNMSSPGAECFFLPLPSLETTRNFHPRIWTWSIKKFVFFLVIHNIWEYFSI